MGRHVRAGLEVSDTAVAIEAVRLGRVTRLGECFAGWITSASSWVSGVTGI